jgi:hypothetical protein
MKRPHLCWLVCGRQVTADFTFFAVQDRAWLKLHHVLPQFPSFAGFFTAGKLEMKVNKHGTSTAFPSAHGAA